jgi:glycosyl transferase family 25
MRLIDFFARTYILNLPERTDHRKEIEAMFRRVGLAIEPGKVDYFEAIRPETADDYPNIGAKGGFLSHRETLRLARDQQLPNVLVMEDDLDISPKFAANPGPILDQLREQDWGIVYFGHYLDPDGTAGPALRPYKKEIGTTHFLCGSSTGGMARRHPCNPTARS